jgi:hypothetical protein
VQSVENKPDICGIPNYDNDLLPLWDLVAEINPAKALEIEREFQNIVTARGTKLAGYMYVPASSQTYIAAIDIQKIASSNTTVPGGINMSYKLSAINLSSYAYLLYRPVNENDTRAIDFIGSYQAANSGSDYIDDGYEWVGLHPDFAPNNPEAVSRFYIYSTFPAYDGYTYLTVHYNPFEW